MDWAIGDSLYSTNVLLELRLAGTHFSDETYDESHLKDDPGSDQVDGLQQGLFKISETQTGKKQQQPNDQEDKFLSRFIFSPFDFQKDVVGLHSNSC